MTSSSTYSTPPPLHHHIYPSMPHLTQAPQKAPTQHQQHPDAFTHRQSITLTPHCTSTPPSQRPITPPPPTTHLQPSSHVLAASIQAYQPPSPPACHPIASPALHNPTLPSYQPARPSLPSLPAFTTHPLPSPFTPHSTLWCSASHQL